MRYKIGLCIVFAASFAFCAKSININGTVKNKSGKPIAGAIIALSSRSLADTTDANGAYSITNGGVAINSRPHALPNTNEVTLEKGRIRLSLMNPAPVTIEMFDMRGNLLEKIVDRNASEGDFRFDLLNHPLAARIMIIRVSIGQRTSLLRYLPVSKDMRSAASAATASPVSSVEKNGLTKIQADADSLKISASWYISKDTSIASYQSKVDITLDTLSRFSFFVTSLKALQELSKNQNGFGGDFRFGKTGAGAGLLGADSICQCIAERSMPGSKIKKWRAFLSVVTGPDGTKVNAIDRIGQGPWYDRLGNLLAPTIKDLQHVRPMNGAASIKNDLPNEDGINNHRPDPLKDPVDNHHFVTGSDTLGNLFSSSATCADWTSTTASGAPRCGFSFPRGGGGGGGGGGMGAAHWISGFDAASCKAEIHITSSMGGSGIGSNGGYGGFYCFALEP